MNAKQFMDNNLKWLEEAKEELADTARGLAVTALNYILEHSPQYSGDFVANWNFSINNPDTTFKEAGIIDTDEAWLSGTSPLHRGEPRAIALAKSRNKGKDNGYKLGDSFYLTNDSAHNEPYAQKIENGTIKFRPENVGSDAPVQNTLNLMSSMYSIIGKADSKKLQKVKI